MAQHALDRRQVLDRVSAVAKKALGDADEVSWIDVTAAPQGLADTGFSFRSMRTRDDRGKRKPGAYIRRGWDAELVYAHRLNVHDRGESRRDAFDRLDALERALSQSGAANAGIELHRFEQDEALNDSREWLIFICRLSFRSLYHLREPQALAS